MDSRSKIKECYCIISNTELIFFLQNQLQTIEIIALKPYCTRFCWCIFIYVFSTNILVYWKENVFPNYILYKGLKNASRMDYYRHFSFAKNSPKTFDVEDTVLERKLRFLFLTKMKFMNIPDTHCLGLASTRRNKYFGYKRRGILNSPNPHLQKGKFLSLFGWIAEGKCRVYSKESPLMVDFTQVSMLGDMRRHWIYS